MDAFEQVVKLVLEREGMWVRQGYKVVLSKEEKIACGRSTSPRWEIDLIAYDPGEKLVLAVECKSYLDSGGVSAKGFVDSDTATKSRFKLFNEAKLRSVVLSALLRQLVDQNLVEEGCRVRLALAAGRFVKDSDRDELRARFEKNGW